MNLLETRQLVTGWQCPVHRPVSFAVKRGDILDLTGSNGTGKSTLLTALAGCGAQVFPDISSANRQSGSDSSLNTCRR